MEGCKEMFLCWYIWDLKWKMYEAHCKVSWLTFFSFFPFFKNKWAQIFTLSSKAALRKRELHSNRAAATRILCGLFGSCLWQFIECIFGFLYCSPYLLFIHNQHFIQIIVSSWGEWIMKGEEKDKLLMIFYKKESKAFTSTISCLTHQAPQVKHHHIYWREIDS